MLILEAKQLVVKPAGRVAASPAFPIPSRLGPQFSRPIWNVNRTSEPGLGANECAPGNGSVAQVHGSPPFLRVRIVTGNRRYVYRCDDCCGMKLQGRKVATLQTRNDCSVLMVHCFYRNRASARAGFIRSLCPGQHWGLRPFSPPRSSLQISFVKKSIWGSTKWRLHFRSRSPTAETRRRERRQCLCDSCREHQFHGADATADRHRTFKPVW